MIQNPSRLLVLSLALATAGCETFSRSSDEATKGDNGQIKSVQEIAALDADVEQRKAHPAAPMAMETGMPVGERVLADSEAEAVEMEGDSDDEDIWERLRANFKLDLDKDNNRIQTHRNWYARNQLYMDRTMARAQRYLHYILDEIEERELPGELALLPIVESAFDPFAYSHGRAAGIWQFIPSTGRHFGMEQSWWYDGRRDIIASTEGALTYLDQLSQRFDDDFELALAAYNAGGGRVSGAQRRNANAGKSTDFWSLSLPRETRHYVPKLIALAQVIKEPEEYGIVLPEMPNEPYFEVVDIQGQIDLAQAAEMADVDVQEIYRLNPGFNRWATAPEGPHRLLIPRENADAFKTELAELPPEKRMRWKTYTVQRGDTLGGIAQRFNTRADAIRKNNNISGHVIRQGQDLLIPVAAQSGDTYALSENRRREARQAASGGGGQNRIDHAVQQGDTLWDIARAHNVSVGELATWNNMAPGDPIRPGDELAVWTNESTASASNSDRDDRDGMVRRVGYTVRSGDSLNRIANRFNVGTNEIARWNDINTSDYLQPGQQLKLYVDIRNSP